MIKLEKLQVEGKREEFGHSERKTVNEGEGLSMLRSKGE